MDSRLSSTLSGVIPRIFRVRLWRGRVESEEGHDWVFCFFLLLSAFLNTRLGCLPSGDVGGGSETCWEGEDCV